ncbi:MAG: hypothetical protein ACI8S6_003751 [Myxococcota bacterium]|jgi:hypothetical protein
MSMVRVVMVTDEPDEVLQRCADKLDGTPETLPENASFVVALMDAPESEPLVLVSGSTLRVSEAVREAFGERPLSPVPGIGEAIRRELPPPFDAVTEILAGTMATGRLVVALPASTEAARIAGTILPAIAQVLSQPDTPIPEAPPAAAPAAAVVKQSEEVPGRVEVSALGQGSAPEAAEGGRWQSALSSMGATLSRDRWYALPDLVSEQAAVREVLEGAGERAVAVMPDGREVGVFGFPDLRRPSSRVLVVGVTRGVLEVAVLHRHPASVGIVGRGTFLRSGEVDDEATARTGQPTPYGGMLFALAHGAVYIERDGRIYLWDGKRERDEGSEGQATASLLLRWSLR